MPQKYEQIIIMKYGIHASEQVDDIMSRKENEIRIAGEMFWGYGGSVCHPITQVNPFVNDNAKNNKKTYLLLTKTESELNNAPKEQFYYSFDKNNWEKLPNGICVKGSKYALICKKLKKCDFEIDLSEYCVAIGKNKGKRLNEYIQGRVDKACAVRKISNSNETKIVKISYVAEVDDKGAAFVK